MLLSALLVVCIIFLTPMTLVDQLSPIINSFTQDKSDFFAVALQNFFAPLLILTFNSGILPTIIDFIAYLEGHKTKGARQLGIMRKNFFFQMFNIIFLQLTGQNLIKGFILDFSQ